MGRILVVEDDALLSKLYRTLIEKTGQEVIVANDGDQGFALARTHKPDLIVLDIMMPKMNGLQVLDALKKDPVTVNIPVMVLTGLSQVNQGKDVLARGASMYFDKSETDPKRVAEIVSEAVGKQVKVAVTEEVSVGRGQQGSGAEAKMTQAANKVK